MIVSLLDPFDDIGIIIAFIQTQMMQSIDDLLRPVWAIHLEATLAYWLIGYIQPQAGPRAGRSTPTVWCPFYSDLQGKDPYLRRPTGLW